MTVHPEIFPDSKRADHSAIEQIVQLYTVLALVEQMAGSASSDATPIADEAAMVRAYTQTNGVTRRRFQSIADEVAIMAASGADALINRAGDIQAAARQLAGQMRDELNRLAEIAAVNASGR